MFLCLICTLSNSNKLCLQLYMCVYLGVGLYLEGSWRRERSSIKLLRVGLICTHPRIRPNLQPSLYCPSLSASTYFLTISYNRYAFQKVQYETVGPIRRDTWLVY